MAEPQSEIPPKVEPQAPSEAQPEVSEASPSKVKEMRRVAQKSQAPLDKVELIQYLSDRISQAEDALADTEQLLQSEVKQRQNIASQIQQRNTQLQNLYEVDQKALPQKIRQKLTQILTTTINQKVQAEQRLSDQKTKNYQYKRMYDELKWEEKNITHKLNQYKEREEKLQIQMTALQEENNKHQSQLKEQEASFLEFKEKKEGLENKYLQMKVALDRMGDFKAVLNRFFGNQDLFDQKMELREQQVRRVEIPSRESQNRQPPKELKTQTNKLKPLNYSAKGDDEDFWRGDFKGKK